MYFLEGKRIGLRALVEADTDGNYQNWFHDSDVCMYNSHHRYVMSRRELLEYCRKSQEIKDAVILAVELKETKVHIGNIALQRIHYIDRSAEIAFIFGEKEYWKQGYATEAAAMLIDHAFGQLGLQRIYFGTAKENAGMQRLGEKLCFQREGIRRNAFYKNGAFHDIYEYGLLRQEWGMKDV